MSTPFPLALALRARLQAGASRLTRLLLPAETPVADFPFAPSDVALYGRHLAAAKAAGQASGYGMLDRQTWDDMLMADYSAQLAHQTSIFGQQELHRRLRGDAGAADEGEAAAARVRLLLQAPEQLRQLRQTCDSLRRARHEVSTPLFGPGLPAAPRWSAYLRWLPLLFLLALAGGVATGWWPLWLLVGLGWVALMAVQVRFAEQAEEWDLTLASLRQMLRSHSLLAGLDHPRAEPLRAGAAQAGKINRAISRSPLDQLVPGAREYADWLWLKNIRHYFASRELVRQEGVFLRRSFELVAQLEADIALARHLLQTPRYCWAEPAGQIDLEQVVHPLLARAAPLSFQLDADGGADANAKRQGAFISGQNGIGKSTLLRTVGLNLIAARAFGFCYAERACVPRLPVYSSMQTEDSLASGESLYIAELRRARELLALAERGPALFIIDEIFRGTNHLESISAAVAVLHTLAASGRVIVSSHNLVLAPLLADRLAPWCVSAPGGDQARLQLAPGVLAETNGITLLAARGFDDATSSKANRVFDWLSDYMAHPADCAALRANL